MLWVSYTTPWTSTNETPFNLIIGTKAVIPIEIGLSTMIIECYDESSNPIRLKANLNLIEKIRDKAHLRMVDISNKSLILYFSGKIQNFLP